MKKKSLLTFLSAVTVSLGALSLVAPASSADPITPRYDYSGVGSDTTGDVWNGLANGYSTSAGTVAPLAPNVASYNAFPAKENITVNGVTFTRPAGSHDGVRALSASYNPVNHSYRDDNGVIVNLRGRIQFARSSSGPFDPRNPGIIGTDLTYIPFARDAISVAVRAGGLLAKKIETTTAELANVYRCVPGATVKINDVPTAVTPVLPLRSSGTRTSFLRAIGLNEFTIGGCVRTSGEPNRGELIPNVGEIAPFSVGQWIAQQNETAGLANTTQGVSLATINGLRPLDANGNPGPLYGDPTQVPFNGIGTFARDTYNVIPTSQATPGNPLYELMKNARSAQAVTDFGFMKLIYPGVTGERKGAFTNFRD